MKVGYLITRSVHGGAQSHILELIDGIRPNHQVALAVGDEGWLTDEVRARGLPVTVVSNLVPSIRPFRDWLAFFQVRKWLAAERPDVLHTHSSKAGFVGRMAARSLGVPSVFTAHGWAFADGTTAMRKLLAVSGEWFAARMGGDIVCVSCHDRELARKYRISSDAKLHTIWNGIVDVNSRAEPGSSTEPVVIMVARFEPPKDFATLLRAMATLSDFAWRLWLVGDGPLLAGTQALASGLGLTRVEFLGTRADVPELLAQSDVFVLASKFEGLPISIVEAMRAGLPVIASSVGGIPELVDATSGILVPPGNSAALAVAVARLLRSQALLRALGAKGRERYETDFKADVMLKKVMDIYRTCVDIEGHL